MTAGVRGDVASRDRISLEFTGLTAGTGELTWGQRFVWNIVQSLAPANHYLNLAFRVYLPTDATRDRVLAAVRTLVSRHETLRTRFPAGPDGGPRQECDAAGELPVDICVTDPGRVRRVAEREEERLWREPFRHESRWPMRVSVIAAGGRPRQVAFVFSHLAVDAWACALLRGEFLDLIRNDRSEPTTSGRGEPARTGWQPRALAAFELSEAGRRTNDASLAYWRKVLSSAPQTAFPTQPEAGETPLFPGVGLHSVALAAAARTVAARLRVGPAAVLLGVLGAILGIRTGTDAVPLFLAGGNRFTPADAASVGTFYQGAPAVVRLSTGSLAGTIRNAHAASTVAYLRGRSDPRDVARLLEGVNARRGTAFDLSSTVNVVPEPGAVGTLPAVPDVAALRELTASTTVSDLDGRDSERLKVYLHVKSLRSRATVEFFCDSRYLTAAAARKILAGLELVLIALLEAGDLSLDAVADVTGIAPLGRPPGCVLVDHCWVDVDAVGALLRGLPDTLAARAFAVPAGDGTPRLVGYLAATRPTTPEQVHAAVCGRLDGGLTLAPQWYVICAGAPDQPQSRAGWERQPVLLSGDGRAAEPEGS